MVPRAVLLGSPSIAVDADPVDPPLAEAWEARWDLAPVSSPHTQKPMCPNAPARLVAMNLTGRETESGYCRHAIVVERDLREGVTKLVALG